ncbi:MAG: NUDIX domain-containing protein [Tannerella sp.]|jgi:bifunctional NMN adenylyltransferase/nudix hydrolase|nr:NUDIX domain-containing protein [Tannerella sp.]
MNESIGVIIGRFQCPDLTAGHRDLIDFALKQGHNQILVALGCAATPCTRNNPLHFSARVAMIRESYPGFMFMPIHDHPSDQIWSDTLDATIGNFFPHTANITLYGSRDSFAGRYYGRFKTCEFEPKTYENATKYREKYGSTIGFNKDYRHGVIYGAYQKFNTVYQTVDVAIFTGNNNLILGRKNIHGSKFLFPGGFVDPRDKNLKDAVAREVMEEAGVEVFDIEYLDSFAIDDYRYRYETDKIMTHFHRAKITDSEVKKMNALDDLDCLYRLSLNDSLIDDMADPHKLLMSYLLNYLKQ